MYKTIEKTELWLRLKPMDHNQRGNWIHRAFYPTERYIIDFAEDFVKEGWMQFDTDQDAAYFGCWVNPTKLMTLTYCEGDWSLVVCPDKEHYNAEITHAIAFYDEGYEFKTIDENGITEYRQDRTMFLVS